MLQLCSRVKRCSIVRNLLGLRHLQNSWLQLTEAECVGFGPEAVARAGVGAPTALRMVLTTVGACANCRCPDHPVTCKVHAVSSRCCFMATTMQSDMLAPEATEPSNTDQSRGRVMRERPALLC